MIIIVVFRASYRVSILLQKKKADLTLSSFSCCLVYQLTTYSFRKKFEEELEEFRNEKKLEERRQRYCEHEVPGLSWLRFYGFEKISQAKVCDSGNFDVSYWGITILLSPNRRRSPNWKKNSISDHKKFKNGIKR